MTSFSRDTLRAYLPIHLSIRGDPAKLCGRLSGARDAALKYRDIFGEGNFYLELQDHGIEGQAAVNRGVIQIHRETGIPLVATNDVHYLRKEDAAIHDVLLCIQTNNTVDSG